MLEPRVTYVHGKLQLVLNSIALVHEGNVLWTRLSVFDCQSVWLCVYLSFFSLCTWLGSDLFRGSVDPQVGLGCK